MKINQVLIDSIKQGRSPFENRFITIESLVKLLKQSDSPLIVYGAGGTCSDTIKILFEYGILPFCITDSDSAKANTFILHLPVLSPEEALRKAGPDAVCIVAIWSISTFYKTFVQQLHDMGYRHVYFLNISFRPRVLPREWVEDVQRNETLLLSAIDHMSDAKSKERFEDLILSFLSSKADHCGVLGQYRSLDGELLYNDLLKAGTDDILVRCRTGFKDDNDAYLSTVTNMKEAYLFEPTWAGRIKTKEFFHDRNADRVLVYPYLLRNTEDSEEIFEEKIFFSRFIDQEEYRSAYARTFSLDSLADELRPTILHLEMSGGHLEALKGSRRIISESKPWILLSGYRLASEAAKVIKAYPDNIYSMRYFGGITMREGFVLIMKPRTREAL